MKEPYNVMEEQLWAEGYEPGGWDSGDEIDSGVCERTPCPACGVPGAEYHPWTKLSTHEESWVDLYAPEDRPHFRVYRRAFVVCECGNWEEF
jgi:hypothetical protein